MRFSTLILSWQRPAETIAAVESVERQDYQDREIIVWDNGSPAACQAELQQALGRRCGVKLILAGRNYGPSLGRNLAAREARGEALLFLDSDAELVGSKALTRLAWGLSRFPDAGALNLEIRTPTGSVCWPFARPRATWGRSVFDIAHIDGCGVCFRRRAFDQAGGFPAHFGYGAEEQYLARCCIAAGWRVLYFPEAAVVHKRVPAGRTPDQFVTMLRNHLWIPLELYPLPWALASILKTALFFLRDAWRERRLREYPRGLYAGLVGFRLSRRRPIRRDRWRYLRHILTEDRRLSRRPHAFPRAAGTP